MKNKNTLWVILVLVAVVVGGYIYWSSQQPDSSASVFSLIRHKAAQTSGTKPTSTSANSVNYTNALKKYGSNRIQFDQSCQMIPNNAVYKAGTQVMFDNRANVSRIINFNGRKISIGAYNFVIVSMTASKYPATIYPDCGSSQNVGTILIEK